MLVSLFGCEGGGPSGNNALAPQAPSVSTGGGGGGLLVQPSLQVGGANFVDISATGQGRRLADDEVVNVPLGFSLTGFGQTFSSVNVSSNGLLSFSENNNSFLNVPLPSQLAPGGSLAVLWGDWGPPAAGNWVFTETRGTAPDRQFIVQWGWIGQVASPSG